MDLFKESPSPFLLAVLFVDGILIDFKINIDGSTKIILQTNPDSMLSESVCHFDTSYSFAVLRVLL